MVHFSRTLNTSVALFSFNSLDKLDQRIFISDDFLKVLWTERYLGVFVPIIYEPFQGDLYFNTKLDYDDAPDVWLQADYEFQEFRLIPLLQRFHDVHSVREYLDTLDPLLVKGWIHVNAMQLMNSYINIPVSERKITNTS